MSILDPENIRGTPEDGPFRDFIGADGTCIWAAATSIPASLSAFLLACILARAWDAKKATSIWAELIHERAAHVEAQLNMKKLVNPHTEMAIRQNISRADLAKWDASARAWLRRADQSMLSHHVQFKLVMRNVKTPFLEPGTTFEKVTSGWIQSMKVVEDSETYHRRFPIEQFWSQSEHGIYIQTCWPKVKKSFEESALGSVDGSPWGSSKTMANTIVGPWSFYDAVSVSWETIENISSLVQP
ncbi:uncharacterized protein FOBCDRAFT_204193 [Fusarium oxysporum Fo47]|uniref:uncharacterized protein n=1 Tax=Fusarium oxysporum Fo47 TaxID=660027 RepID=UPI002869E4B7|nr:uncharacterized protein FOBCDRAFT_204193 [Fusarium oxysporum Fo47]QKD57205.2 hypothetical protein FOBCDRAFT_204193 [Fusarium oxysporum Fo47]